VYIFRVAQLFGLERVAALLAGPFTASTPQRRVVSFPLKKTYPA
jgi:hypothetical protein